MHRTPWSTPASLAGRAPLLGIAIVAGLCAGACSNSITYSRINATTSDSGVDRPVDRPVDASDGASRGTGGGGIGTGGAGISGSGGTDAGGDGGIDTGVDTQDGATGFGGVGTGGAGVGGMVGTGGAGVGGAGVGGTPGTGGAIVDSAQYNFESTAQGWAADGPWTGFGRTTTRTFAGLASLGGTLTFTPVAGGTGTSAELWLSPAAGTGPVAGSTVTFHIFLPADAAGTIAWVQPYVQDGSAAQTFTGTYTVATALRFGDWTTIAVPLPITTVVPIFKLAVQIFASGPTAFTGTIYIDSVGW